MDRAFASGAAGSAPAAPASPSIGYPTSGNPSTGTPATKPGAYWYHQITEELLTIILAAGIEPAQGTLAQVKQALDMIYGSKIQSISASVAANALTLTLNPTGLNFRSAPVSSGAVAMRLISNAISVVVPTGATLGTVSGQAARIVLLAIDNAGTVELGVVNLAGGINLDETTLISTTAISAAATAANVIYSTIARASVPFRVVGFIDITEAAAGTWATAPTTIQGQGGQALAALQSFGYGQTWQDVAGSRALATTYYNTTGRPIYVTVTGTNGGANPSSMTATVQGVIVQNPYGYGGASNSVQVLVAFMVPPGASYSVVAANATILKWAELR